MTPSTNHTKPKPIQRSPRFIQYALLMVFVTEPTW
jgi:hypothetical protein